ncbi:hypothetical protein OAN68_04375, partial [Candidatus Pelagibacter sp.]|nr:hypothetical protein [Candidatus Pelagibacter sp.]
MKSLVIRIGTLLISTFLVLIIYLSFVGIETNRFNQQIKKEIKKINKNFEIELKDISINFDLLDLKFNIKTLGTNLKYENKEVQLERIESSISLKSIISNKFSLKELEISTKAIKVRDLISFFRILNNDPKLFIAEQFIKKGYILADININLDEEGRIKDDFNISGFLKKGSLKTLRNIDLSEINLNFKLNKDEFLVNNFSLLLNNNKFSIPQISAKKFENKFLFKGKVNNKKIILKEKDLKKIINIEDFDLKFDKVEFTSENNFSFEIDRKFNFDKFEMKSSLNLEDLYLINEFDLKGIFPQFKDKINFKKHIVNLEYKKDFLKIEGEGDFIIKESDKIKYKIIKKREDIDFESILVISNNVFKLDILGYQKKDKSNLKLSIKGKQDSNKNISFKEVSLIENNNIINIKNLSIKNNNNVKSVERIN